MRRVAFLCGRRFYGNHEAVVFNRNGFRAGFNLPAKGVHPAGFLLALFAKDFFSIAFPAARRVKNFVALDARFGLVALGAAHGWFLVTFNHSVAIVYDNACLSTQNFR